MDSTCLLLDLFLRNLCFIVMVKSSFFFFSVHFLTHSCCHTVFCVLQMYFCYYVSPLRWPWQNTTDLVGCIRFFTIQGARSPRSKCSRGWFLVRPRLLALLRWCPHGVFGVHPGSESAVVGVPPSSNKDTSSIRLFWRQIF